MSIQTFFLEHLNTPIGRMMLISDEQHCLRAVGWEDHEQRMQRSLWQHYSADAVRLHEGARSSWAHRSLRDYFDGDLDALTGLPIAINGTSFQRTVWDALRHIPVGQTISYSALAARIGRPSAIRAVGLANGANPIAIVVPCHRVVGSDASLTGYGGGLERKRWLLAHEKAEGPWLQTTLAEIRTGTSN